MTARPRHGEVVDGPIDRTRFGSVAWLPGGEAFYYARQLPPATVPAGEEAYHRHQAAIRKRIRNVQPVAPREARTAIQVYMQAPDYTRSDGDVNAKGGLILYTLRHVIGDKAFFAALRRMAYPDPAMEKVTDGRQCRFATTDDFLHIAERDMAHFPVQDAQGWMEYLNRAAPYLHRRDLDHLCDGVRKAGLPI